MEILHSTSNDLFTLIKNIFMQFSWANPSVVKGSVNLGVLATSLLEIPIMRIPGILDFSFKQTKSMAGLTRFPS
jgi:hypothetical protein